MSLGHQSDRNAEKVAAIGDLAGAAAVGRASFGAAHALDDAARQIALRQERHFERHVLAVGRKDGANELLDGRVKEVVQRIP